LHHGRFDVEEFVRIAHEEMRFIQKDFSTADKITQVKWNERTRKWYPVAMNIMLQLMSSDKPVEFASELLLPFTLDCIRHQSDPWKTMSEIEPAKYQLPAHVARYHAYFSACGSHAFASAMSRKPVLDMRAAQQLIQLFTVADVVEAASFHGDIGESARTLDATAAAEQAKVLHTNSQEPGRDSIQIQPNDSAGPQEQNSNPTLEQLRLLGARYLEKFKFKFLISAQGKTGEEMLAALQARLDNSSEQELANARKALWQITRKRLCAQPRDSVVENIQAALQRHNIVGASISVSAADGAVQSLQFGQRAAGQPVTSSTCFEIASLSKSIATCFAMEYFRAANIPLDTCVNALLSKTSSGIRVLSLNPKHPEWADQVTLAHLMSHEALNLHYVSGISTEQSMPSATQLIKEHDQFNYEPTGVLNEPGSAFQYSGGGFIVLEHVIETLAAQDVATLTAPFLRALHMNLFTFEQSNQANMEYASGFTDSGQEIEGTRIMFPAFAAGAVAPAQDVATFLHALTNAYHNLEGVGPISHDTAVRMLHGVDKGSQKFMGCNMGLGIFTADAGSNRLCIHQGANDGFRALFIHCYAGPDKGAGLVILANGEHNGVLCIAEVAQIVLHHFKMQGVDVSRFQNQFVADHIPQEQRVNAGYRELIFGAFQADLPEAITRRGSRDPLADFNLAVGARIEEVSNQRFARAENLLSPNQPTFEPALFGKQGKVMDSWESVRHNPRACDHLIFEMEHAAAIDCVTVSTQFHLGNHAPAIRVQGWDTTNKCWQEIVALSPLAGHSFHAFNAVSHDAVFTRIQVSMYPDGGVTRLALYGKNLPPQEKAKLLTQPCVTCPPFDTQTSKPLTPKYAANRDAIKRNLARFAPSANENLKARVNQSVANTSSSLNTQYANARAKQGEVDLACAAFGATIVSASNQHYGPAAQVISPYPPLNMFDGLESARSREAGHSENVVIALARPARISRVEIAFTYFVNNNPREITVEGLCSNKWVPLVERTKVKAFAANSIQFAIHHPEVCDQIRVTAFPDGGMNRVRVFAAL
jgi:allantoicase/CubicO group peptidase (beta-lactamase class C family)